MPYVCRNIVLLKYRKRNILIYGGERGIRTLDSIATIHAFQALRLEKSIGNTTINQYLFLITKSVSAAYMLSLIHI